jgi:hypothetical protein
VESQIEEMHAFVKELTTLRDVDDDRTVALSNGRASNLTNSALIHQRQPKEGRTSRNFQERMNVIILHQRKCATPLFVQQLLSILHTLFLWIHPTDLDKQGSAVCP